jgi:hypothetical protein
MSVARRGVDNTELAPECRSGRLKKLQANTENTLARRGIAPTGPRAAGADAIVFVLPVRHAARLGDPLAVCTFWRGVPGPTPGPTDVV